MNREIKFRGKCINSGELVYGDLIHGVGWKKGKVYILPDVHNLAYVKHCDPLDGVQVIPASVGQYTGLKDKNGKEIYEGDIIAKIMDIHIDEPKKFYQGAVVFHYGCFCMEYDKYYYPLSRQHGVCEVIGNIYQNPELLK